MKQSDNKNWPAHWWLAGQSGVVAVVTALVIVVMLGFAALAIDLGYLAWVKADLQKAADAGALAGARVLAPYVGSPLHPDWSSGESRAAETVKGNLNAVDNELFKDCQAEPGYWSLTAGILQSSSITPSATDVPAIQVTVSKADGLNNGPLQLLMGVFVGKPTVAVRAQAIAILTFPNSMPNGTLFPMAAAATYVNRLLPLTPPVSFKIGDGAGDYGQWTSFKVNNNSASYIDGLISGGNPTSLKLNDNIYIQPGVKASNYGSAASYVGKTVVIPLVRPADINQTGLTPALGFVAFRIEAVSQSKKYIQGHYDKDFNINNALVVGGPETDPNTGSPDISTPNPPKLVK